MSVSTNLSGRNIKMHFCMWLWAVAAVSATAQNVSPPVTLEAQEELFNSQQGLDLEAAVHTGDGRGYQSAGSCSKTPLLTTLSLGDYSVITSTSYPDVYPDAQLCGWWFYTTPNARFEMACDSVVIQPSDFLLVYSGSHAFEIRWTNVSSPVTYTSKTNEIMIAFSTDWLGSAKGFHCVVTAVTPLCTCGKSKSGGRIVGGTETPPLEYPWMVGIVNKVNGTTHNLLCGGALISNEWIVTSAWCSSGTHALLGAHDRNVNASMQFAPILNKIYHYNYQGSYQFAIALYKIAPLNWTATVARPICLPQAASNFFSIIGKNGTVIGWGKTNSSAGMSNVLMRRNTTIISTCDCVTKCPEYIFTLTGGLMCARDSDVLDGDIGGPLMLKNETNYYLAGIVTSPYPCSKEGNQVTSYVSLYTGLPVFVNWIYNKTAGSEFCPIM